MTDDVIEAILNAVGVAQGRRFIVVRGTGSARYDGVWHDQDAMPRTMTAAGLTVTTASQVTLKATGELERREDGMLAAVVRPEENDR